MPNPIDLHRHTPNVTACDQRGLPVLAIAYHRRIATEAAGTRTERQAYDARGHLSAQWDARLWADGGAAGVPNQSTVYGFSGQPLRTESAGAGWRMHLSGDTGQAREDWDGRGTHRWIDYDEQLRPLAVTEQMETGPHRCVERFTYGDNGEEATNRCGRMLRHDDPAGSAICPGYGLAGRLLAETRYFLSELEVPDWPAAMADRDGLLETDAQGLALSHTTHWLYDATGAPWQQTDAAGGVRSIYIDVAGQPRRIDFQPSGGVLVTLAHDMRYDAFGQPVAETAGNGVMTITSWSVVDGRLRQRQVARAGHLLQDVDYTYDPIGNITRIEDRAQPTTWFDGAQIDPVSTYAYDTLYQLIDATGRESVQAMIGPALPGLLLPGGGEANRRRRYTQTYTYDASGNLCTLSHTASDQGQYTRTMAVAARSNRSLYHPAGAPPPDFAAGFDSNGNQLELDRPTMAWDARNRLQRVTQLVRADAPNDEETYVYDGAGIRRRKVRRTLARAVTHEEEVRYLPGLEQHRNTGTNEVWNVANVPAGRCTVRWLHWQANSRKEVPSSQWRYSIDDHLGSSTLELDDDADVISHEGYYPFGGTAWWAARSEVDATYRTIRYSGKERDASGLYYYGYRYYAPWLCRWINPDPAGDIDGLNRYRMVGNRPLSHVDPRGLAGETNVFQADWDEIHDEGVDLRPGTLWGDSEAMLGPTGGYFDPILEQRLQHRNELASAGTAFVTSDIFTHKTSATNETLAQVMDASAIASVASEPLDEDSDPLDEFINKYSPKEWTFRKNFKGSKSSTYFANDMARVQYRIIAKKNDIFGVLPPVLRRKDVINIETLKQTEGLPSRSPELYRAFLDRTVNGKTTQRILKDFGLQATSVVREDTFFKWNPETKKTEKIFDNTGLLAASLMLDEKVERYSDFVVHVKPALGSHASLQRASRQATDRHAPY